MLSPRMGTAQSNRRRSVFGRETELSKLEQLAEARCPLVTVLGPGGMGKTTLARLHAAAQRARGRPICWVDLEGTRTVEALAGAILGAALGPGPAPEEPSEARVARTLATAGDLLLVLDNLEQLLPDAAPLIARWTESAPELCVLVTSRSTLRVSFETVFELSPLDLEASAQTLFVERLQGSRPGWVPTPSDAQQIAAIVAAVDGIPLAIELAAARARVVELGALAEQLRQDPSQLGPGPVDAPARHRTLEAAIEGSILPLAPEARAALAVAARFRRPFGANDLARVMTLNEAEGLSRVTALRDQALLFEAAPGRFAIYAPIQAYVEQRGLDEGAADEAQGRYEEEVLAQARAGQPRQEDLLALLERPTPGEPGAIARALEAAALLPLRELVPTERSRLEARLRHALGQAAELPVDRVTRARAHLALGDLEWFRGRNGSAQTHAEAGHALLKGAAQPALEARANFLLGQCSFAAGAFEAALAVLSTAQAQATERQDRRLLAEVLQCVGAVRQSLGQHAEAEADLLSAQALARTIGARDIEAHLEASLGALLVDQGRLQAAERRLSQAVALAEEARQTRTLQVTQCYLAVALLEQGQWGRAETLASSAWESATQSGNEFHAAVFSVVLGAVLASQDRIAEAEELFEAAERPLSGQVPWMQVTRCYRGLLHLARARATADPVAAGLQLRLAEACLDRQSATASFSDDLRIATRILEGALATAETRHGARPKSSQPPSALLLGPELAWFSVDGGPRVDLGRRPLLRSLLASLAEQQGRDPNCYLSPGAMVAQAWPGEHFNPEVHFNRLHVALSSLRKLGLKALIERAEAGYRLLPSIELRRLG